MTRLACQSWLSSMLQYLHAMNIAVKRRKIKGAKLMGTWDEYIFTSEDNVDFLDDLNSLEEDDVIEAIHDAIMLATGDNQATEEEQQNALAAATIAAIW